MRYVVCLVISLVCFSARADVITIMQQPFDGYDLTEHSYAVDKFTGAVQIELIFNKPTTSQGFPGTHD